MQCHVVNARNINFLLVWFGLILQMLMSVRTILITAVQMPTAQTQKEAMTVPAMNPSLVMD